MTRRYAVAQWDFVRGGWKVREFRARSDKDADRRAPYPALVWRIESEVIDMGRKKGGGKKC